MVTGLAGEFPGQAQSVGCGAVDGESSPKVTREQGDRCESIGAGTVTSTPSIRW